MLSPEDGASGMVSEFTPRRAAAFALLALVAFVFASLKAGLRGWSAGGGGGAGGGVTGGGGLGLEPKHIWEVFLLFLLLAVDLPQVVHNAPGSP